MGTIEVPYQDFLAQFLELYIEKFLRPFSNLFFSEYICRFAAIDCSNQIKLKGIALDLLFCN